MADGRRNRRLEPSRAGDRRIWGWILVTALALLTLYYTADVLLLIFAGILLAVFLRGLSDWLSQHARLPEKWAVALVVVVLAGLFSLGMWLGGTRLAEQAGALREELPRAAQKLRAQIEGLSWGETLLERMPRSADLIPRRRDLLSRVGGAVSTTLGIVGDGVVILFLGLFAAAQPKVYLDGAVRLVPPPKRARAREVFYAVGHTLRYWLLGKILAMVLIGVLTALGLWLLEVPLALTLGILAALLSFIPNFGPILSAAPAVLLALVQGPMRALYVIFLYVGIQAVESYLLTPLVQRRTVSLPPGLTLASQVMAGVLLGGMGLLLATPLAAALLVVVEMLYVQDVLEDPVPASRSG